ncbi:hypothetical protein FQN54_007353 [Arachnomyces sp. PD_36]|nr:hypothetical protein FQN54_007353 [Arachnomyces sp. PD_36]
MSPKHPVKFRVGDEVRRRPRTGTCLIAAVNTSQQKHTYTLCDENGVEIEDLVPESDLTPVGNRDVNTPIRTDSTPLPSSSGSPPAPGSEPPTVPRSQTFPRASRHQGGKASSKYLVARS